MLCCLPSRIEENLGCITSGISVDLTGFRLSNHRRDGELFMQSRCQQASLTPFIGRWAPLYSSGVVMRQVFQAFLKSSISAFENLASRTCLHISRRVFAIAYQKAHKRKIVFWYFYVLELSLKYCQVFRTNHPSK